MQAPGRYGLWPMLAAALCVCGCKVHISDVNARFVIADVSWFEAEETLFVFYEVQAEQGLGDESLLEIRYTTDDGVVDWIDLADLEPVHTHVAVDCGLTARCGSVSVQVPLEPRNVGLRLRYNVDGELSLGSDLVFNVVNRGPSHTQRSLLVYGVFDETNHGIQWRARHRFPTIRNEEAQRLGLRRRFIIDEQRFGPTLLAGIDNPYLYDSNCLSLTNAVPWADPAQGVVDTEERAVFNPADLPDVVADAPGVCGRSTVFDATGPFVANAVARKNPETRPAFPVLRSPTADATPIKYLLQICDQALSSDHLQMQRQRLFLEDVDALCIDDWEAIDFVDRLTERIRDDVDVVRAEGQDMVLSIAIHHNDRALATQVERALEPVLDNDRDRNSPRLAGAFVFDTFPHRVDVQRVAQTTIWCPATLEETGQASEACAIPDFNLAFSLGPLSTAVLPILPSRSQYLNFLETYSESQSGRMRRLAFRTPERPTIADHVDLGDFGVATFFNDEVITADADDAFSYCADTDELGNFVFRSVNTNDVLPVEALPGWHNTIPDATYDLGLGWDFPFSIQLEYAVGIASAINAFSFSLPIGISIGATEEYGSGLWFQESFSLEEQLLHCRRFCDHPTFDAAGVYQIFDLFRGTYQTSCYRPMFPQRGDSGFPDDP
ncbi:MAG: hypothetical protein ACE366_03855 [Bradymonadia bacterium]